MGGRLTPVPLERIERSILLIRGHKAMLDADLGALYGVTMFNLNKAVKRNLGRFPQGFMSQLTAAEANALRFQVGISKGKRRGDRRYLPYVFTEQGVAMLSTVLRSKPAVAVNINIMRAFGRLRRLLASNEELARKLKPYELCRFYFCLYTFYLTLVAPPTPKRRRIGFLVSETAAKYGH
jgi:hypothetical protein